MPWLCVRAAQQLLKLPWVNNTVFSTDPKHGLTPATEKKINPIPAKLRTLLKKKIELLKAIRYQVQNYGAVMEKKIILYTYIQYVYIFCVLLCDALMRILPQFLERLFVQNKIQALSIPSVLYGNKTVCLNETWGNLHSRRLLWNTDVFIWHFQICCLGLQPTTSHIVLLSSLFLCDKNRDNI